MHETEIEFRLRKAKEHLVYCREQENQARTVLLNAVDQTKRAREKYDDLFLECEQQAFVAKLKKANS